MIRITEHTARKPGICGPCRRRFGQGVGAILPGERYRQLVAVAESDIFSSNYVRIVGCALHFGEEFWQLRDGKPKPPPVVHVPEWPVGTDVILRDDDGRLYRTNPRSAPWNLCGHASVLVDGIAGGYICERMTVGDDETLPHFRDRHAVRAKPLAAPVAIATHLALEPR